MRVGIGFDVHPLVKGESLILGGVDIPYEFGLAGHSDADVLTHALIDALLGAMGQGDIGQKFPDTDQRYRGINSLLLLEEISSLMVKKEYSVNNVDLIILAQAPKLVPFFRKMRNNFSRILQVEEPRINLKATTTERLGFIGRREGIAAQAIISLAELKGR